MRIPTQELVARVKAFAVAYDVDEDDAVFGARVHPEQGARSGRYLTADERARAARMIRRQSGSDVAQLQRERVLAMHKVGGALS